MTTCAKIEKDVIEKQSELQITTMVMYNNSLHITVERVVQHSCA